MALGSFQEPFCGQVLLQRVASCRGNDHGGKEIGVKELQFQHCIPRAGRDEGSAFLELQFIPKVRLSEDCCVEFTRGKDLRTLRQQRL